MANDSDAGHGRLAIRIDDRFDAYRPFYDAAWEEQMVALVDGTRLIEPVAALALQWQAAANACALPWMFVQGLAGHWAAFAAGRRPFAAQATEALARQVAEGMVGAVSHAKRRRLEALARSIGSALQDREEAAEAFDPQTLWAVLLADGEFQLALWGSQRLGYEAIWHGYERFARQTVALASGNPERGGRRLSAVLRDADRHLGRRIVQRCLAARPVRIARLVRNALAHSGGRMTTPLASLPHGLAVDAGMVQVLAGDVRALFAELSSRAAVLARAAAALPSVRA